MNYGLKIMLSLYPNHFLISAVEVTEPCTIPAAILADGVAPCSDRAACVCLSLCVHVTVKALKMAPARPPHSRALTNLA